jgi:hypothetical protein
VVDLAETRIDIEVPAGNAGMKDITFSVDDFFKTTITALSANIFPRFIIHK